MPTSIMISFANGVTNEEFPMEFLFQVQVNEQPIHDQPVEQTQAPVNQFKTRRYRRWITNQLYLRLLASGKFQPEQLQGKSQRELVELEKPMRTQAVNQTLRRLTNEDCCAICLNPHTAHTGKFAGLACGHIYCFECIQQSRQVSDKCPCCRNLIDTKYIKMSNRKVHVAISRNTN